MILKNNALEPILGILFSLMSLPPDNEQLEEYFSDDLDNRTPATVAAQTLDLLALHLPPDKFVPHMVSGVIIFFGFSLSWGSSRVWCIHRESCNPFLRVNVSDIEKP